MLTLWESSGLNEGVRGMGSAAPATVQLQGWGCSLGSLTQEHTSPPLGRGVCEPALPPTLSAWPWPRPNGRRGGVDADKLSARGEVGRG